MTQRQRYSVAKCETMPRKVYDYPINGHASTLIARLNSLRHMHEIIVAYRSSLAHSVDFLAQNGNGREG